MLTVHLFHTSGEETFNWNNRPFHFKDTKETTIINDMNDLKCALMVALLHSFSCKSYLDLVDNYEDWCKKTLQRKQDEYNTRKAETEKKIEAL